MKAKAILVLGGGSALGLAHIGVLCELEKHYEISGIVGTSMGAIIGALYSLGLSPQQILEIANRYSFAKAFSPLKLDRQFSVFFDGRSLLQLFDEWTEHRQIEDAKIPFIACAYDLLSRSSVLFDKGSYATAMRASSSLPFIFAPYRYGEYLLVDGGVEHPLPLAFTNLLNGDLVIAVTVLPLVEKKARFVNITDSAPTKTKRVSRREVLMQSVFCNQASISLREINSYAPDIVIEAAMPNASFFGFHKAKVFYEYGRQQTIATLARYDEPKFIPQIRRYYRKLIDRVTAHQD